MNLTNEQIQALLLIATAAAVSPEWYPVGSYGDVVSIDDPKWSAVAEFVKTFNAKTVREILATWEADKVLIAEQAKRIAELEASHSKLRESMAAIHNTIRLDGASTSLSVLLSASKRAYEESAAAAGITLAVGGEDGTN